MFTPPPSPHPSGLGSFPSSSVPPLTPEGTEKLSSSQDSKRCLGRRFRYAVILIPLFVVVLTACARLSTGRVTRESFLPLSPLSWYGLGEDSSWKVHKRSPGQTSQTGSASHSSTTTSASAASSSSQIPINAQPVPMIPSAPPALPTPFPQPFDGSIAQNFSSLTCSNFFANMTNAAPFRSCRPFSMLLGSSSDFINAQVNLTLMNSIIWGTCNTTIPYQQCQSNMGWFAMTLKTACSQELKALNTMAVDTLMELQAFSVMHDVACLADPTSNTYCYLDAVRNSNPSDAYYYGLPLGIGLPKTSTPSCSACSKSVMGLYSAALKDPVQGPLLTGLQTTYGPSAALSVQLCGAGFTQTNVINAAVPTLGHRSWTLGMLAALVAWMILASTS